MSDAASRRSAAPAGARPGPRAEQPGPERSSRACPESAALLVVLGALIVFFSIKSPYFFNTDNFINILIASSVRRDHRRARRRCC